MMNHSDVKRLLAALTPPKSPLSKRLDLESLEDRVMLSATPLDPALLDGEVTESDVATADFGDDFDGGDFHTGIELDDGWMDVGDDCDHDTHDVHLDPSGLEMHALTELPNLEVDPVNDTYTAAAPTSTVPLSQTFFLNSNPDSNYTIFLDFDGHTTSGTSWNSSYNGGNDFTTPAYDFDGDTSTFSDAELQRIQYIWQRVAEDFIPFDVNVTTQDPGEAALIKSGSGDTMWGQRVVIGGSSGQWYGSSAGGVAYVGSFTWGSDTPTFVFENQLGNGNEKYTAEAISHEVGHTLGLRHDGGDGTGYYQGHGSGETGWAPLMGVGYYKSLTQWSKGEYSGATNTQDDLSIITTQNGFGYRVDDHGDSDNQSTALLFDGSNVSGSGIIEQNTDVDVFNFTTDGGLIDLQIDPFERGPNLDILVELYDSASNLILSSNPVDMLHATINATVSAGNYFLYVTGVGKGDPSNGGYSDYGSLGQYTISGSIAPSSADSVSISPNQVSVSEGDSGSTAMTFTVTRSGDLSDATSVDFSVTGTGSNAASADDFVNGVLPSGVINFAAGETSKNVTIYINGDLEAEANEDFTIQLSNAAGDTIITGSQSQGTILNDDAPPPVPGITVTPTSGLTVDESGTSAGFSVVLDSQPTSDVTVYVSSSDTTEGTVDKQFLTFTASNWNVAQTVRITGVDDTVQDGNVTFNVVLSNAQSSDSSYDGFDVDDVQVTNRDNDNGNPNKGGGNSNKGGGGGSGGSKGGGPKKAPEVFDEATFDEDFGVDTPRDEVLEMLADRSPVAFEAAGDRLAAALQKLYEHHPSGNSDDSDSDDAGTTLDV